MPDCSVVVAGGGGAGLVAARRLADAGADVDLFERRAGVGGRIRSRERDGFTLDRGFQVLFAAYPAARRELDLDALDLRAFAPGAVICHPGRRSVLSDPIRDPGAFFETLLNREVTTADKLRTLALRLRPRVRERDSFGAPDCSIREHLRNLGFSPRFVRNFAAPFYGGITLDRSLSTSRHVFTYTFRALSRGRIAVPAGGMGAIPAQLAGAAREAGVTVHPDEAVTAVDPAGRDGGVTVTTGTRAVEADAAVVATDPQTARDLTGVGSIPTDARGCVTQHYAVSDPDAPGCGKRLLLNADGPAPNTVAPMSAVAPEYAPEDRGLLAATFLGRATAWSEDRLAAATREALDSWYPERGLDPTVVATDRIEFAQFSQPPGIHDDLPTVRAPDGPVYLAGEYTTWSSIQGALESGRVAAEALLSDRRG